MKSDAEIKVAGMNVLARQRTIGRLQLSPRATFRMPARLLRFCILVVLAATTLPAKAGLIPWDYTQYIANDWSNLGQICDKSSLNDSTMKNTMGGYITFVGGADVPFGNTIVFYDKTDRQVLGWYDIGIDGLFDLRFAGYGLFFEDEGIVGDEGGVNGDEVGTLLKTSDGKYLNAHFAGTPALDNIQDHLGEFDIVVNPDSVLWVPEPSTGVLLMTGFFGIGALRNVRRSRRE